MLTTIQMNFVFCELIPYNIVNICLPFAVQFAKYVHVYASCSGAFPIFSIALTRLCVSDLYAVATQHEIYWIGYTIKESTPINVCDFLSHEM